MMRYDSLKRSLDYFKTTAFFQFFAKHYEIFFTLLVILFFCFVFSPVVSFPISPFGDLSFLELGKTGTDYSPFFLFLAEKRWLFLGQQNYFGIHLFLCCLHLINGALVFSLSSQVFCLLKREKAPFLVSLIVAVLFLFSPLVIENVAWISTTKETLGATWVLLSLSSFLRYLRKNTKGNYWGALVFSVMAIFVNPFNFSLFFIILIFAFCFRAEYRLKRDVFFESLFFFLPVLFFYNFSSSFTRFFSSLESLAKNGFDLLIQILLIPGFYLQNIFISGPRSLNYHVSFSPLEQRWDTLTLVCCVCFYSAIILFFLFKNWRIFLLPFVLFGLALIFDLRFLFQKYEFYLLQHSKFSFSSFVADRYLYLPFAVFICSFVPVIFVVGERFKRFLPYVFLVFGLYSFQFVPSALDMWSSKIKIITKTYDIKTLPLPLILQLADSFESNRVDPYELNDFWEQAYKQHSRSEIVVVKLMMSLQGLDSAQRFNELFFKHTEFLYYFPFSFFTYAAQIYQKQGEMWIVGKIYDLAYLRYSKEPQMQEIIAKYIAEMKQRELSSLQTLIYHEVFRERFDVAQHYLFRLLVLDPKNERNDEIQKFFVASQKRYLLQKSIKNIKKK